MPSASPRCGAPPSSPCGPSRVASPSRSATVWTATSRSPTASRCRRRRSRAGQGGWELDTRGCVGGLLTLRGRGEDPVAIARAGAPVPVMPGDYGLIQYGQFAIFFQYTAQPIAMSSLRGPELLTMLAIFCSAILHLGMLGLVRTLMTPTPLAKPLELTNPEEYAARFGLKRAVVETPPPEPITVGPGQRRRRRREGSRRAGQEGAGRRQEDQGRRRQVRHERQGRPHPADRRHQADHALRRPQRGPRRRHRQGDPEHAQVDQHRVGGALRAQLEHRRARQRTRHRPQGRGLAAAAAPARASRSDRARSTRASARATAAATAAARADPAVAARGGNGRGGAGGGTGTGNGTGNGPGESKVAVGAGHGASKGGLSEDQVRRVVMAHLGAVRACYESEAQRNPSLKGGVTVQWTIDPSGGVSSASLGGTHARQSARRRLRRSSGEGMALPVERDAHHRRRLPVQVRRRRLSLPRSRAGRRVSLHHLRMQRSTMV